MKTLRKRIMSVFLAIAMMLVLVPPSTLTVNATLIPLEEVKANLFLTGKTKDELKNFSLDEMLTMLQDLDGNHLTIDANAEKVWRYIHLEESNGLEDYEEYSIGENAKIDLSQPDDVTDYELELIIGSKGQLNTSNKRYIIKVYLIDDFEDNIEVEVYLQDDTGKRTQPPMADCQKWTYISNGGLEETNYELSYRGDVVPDSLSANGTVWLNFKTELVNNPRVSVEIYPYTFQTFEVAGQKYTFYMADYSQPISKTIINQDMTTENTGFQISGDKNDDDTFYMIIYVDGKRYTQKNICVKYWYWYPRHEGSIFSLDNGARTDTYENLKTEFNSKTKVSKLTYEMKPEFSADEQYYFDYDLVMQKNYGESAAKDNWDRLVQKIVLGHYDSLEDAEAAGAVDVTNAVLKNGYLADYSAGVDFTIFKYYRMSTSFELIYDTTADKITVQTVDSKNKWRSFTDQPIVGEADPWLRINAVTDKDGNTYDSYVIQNGKSINMDTYYGYGYQTVLINDANADLSQLMPSFWYANTDRVWAVSKDTGEKVEDNHIRNFENANQQYTGIIVDNGVNNARNYWVTFKKLNNSGSELFVYGPSRRQVILNDYFGFMHDVLIANVGNAPLEDISVELVDAENVKIDDYWTVGSDGNNSLGAFSTTDSSFTRGELPNLAKIRLLPDGDGEVKGTLVIKAKGQDPVSIVLNGKAENPEIITESIREAVKYVPYSNIIATNLETDSTHDWVSQEFEVVSGELPDGIELIKNTGEIYGVPTETGEFKFKVAAKFIVDGEEGYFENSEREYTLVVKDNTNENVHDTTMDKQGYEIKVPLGTDEDGDYGYIVDLDNDELIFTSYGELKEFQDLWLNGEKLTEGDDYTKEEGSTRVTVNRETLEGKSVEGRNTIASEFRVDGDRDNDIRRTAENYEIKVTKPDSKPDDSSSYNSEDDSSTSKPDNSSSSKSDDSSSSKSDDSSSSKSDDNSSSKPDDSSSEPDEVADTVTMVTLLTDNSGNPLSNYTIELHSKVQTQKTNKNGYARFSGTEIDSHTFTIKDSSGKERATKSFNIISGNSLKLSGNTITAKKGSTFTLTLKLNGSTLDLVDVVDGDKSGIAPEDDDSSSSKNDSSNTDKNSSNKDNSSGSGNNANGTGSNGNTNEDTTTSPNTGNVGHISLVLITLSFACMVAIKRKEK